MKIYHGINKEKKHVTTAVITNTSSHAKKILASKLGINTSWYDIEGLDNVLGGPVEFLPEFDLRKLLSWNKLTMNSEYKGIVTCDPRDTYDRALGEDLAVSKAQLNLERGEHKAFTRWQEALLNKIVDICPETFGNALVNLIYKRSKQYSENDKLAGLLGKLKDKDPDSFNELAKQLVTTENIIDLMTKLKDKDPDSFNKVVKHFIGE